MTYYLPILLCAALAAFFCYFPITDTDIFWHRAAGREMIAHRHFLYSDPFSFTLASPRWIDLHWLFQLVVYGLYVLGGLKALLWFKLAVVALTTMLLCGAFRSLRYAYASAFLCAILFYEARYLVCERPVLVTLLCMSSYIFLFERVKQGAKASWLWLCLPLQVIWTNSQGLYPIGIFIICAYWIEALFDAKRAARQEKAACKLLFNTHTLTLVFCSLACLLNPYGISGLLLPFRLFGRIAPVAKNLYSLNISENVPLLALTGFEARYRAAVVATAVVSCILFFVNRRNVRPALLVLFLGFLALAYSAVRNVLLYFVIIVPVMGYSVMRLGTWGRLAALGRNAKRLAAFLCAAAAAAILWLPIANHAAVVAVCPPHRILSPFRFPEKITEYLKVNPVAGEMFNDIRYGGYLIWKLYPPTQVFADGRLVIRPPRFFADYLAICEQPELFFFAAEKFNVTHVIVPSAIFTQYRRLIARLCASSEWHLEYTDGSSFLIVKNSASKRPAIHLEDITAATAIADSICGQWRDAPYVRQEALGYFADMLEYLGFEGSAEAVRTRR